MADQIEFEISARLTSIDDALKRVEQNADKTGKKLDQSVGSGFEARAGKAFKGLAIAAAAAGAAIAAGLVVGFSRSIKASIEQENAVNRLNQSLRAAGTFSEETSRSFQELANEIQRNTTIGDEAALGYLALARNLSRTDKEAKNLTLSAINLASATGQSTEAAIRALNQSLSGNAGQLARLIPEVSQFTQEQLKAGAAVDLVARRFAGFAASEARTFQGAFTQLKNIVGDFQEVIGSIITRSPALVAAIKFISEQISLFTDRLKEVRGAGDPFRDILISAIDIARFFTSVLGPAVEFIINRFVLTGRAIGAVAFALTELIQGNFKSAASAFSEGLGDFFNIEESFNFEGTKAGLAFIDGLKEAVETAPPLAENPSSPANQLKEQADQINGITWDGFVTSFNDASNKIQVSAASLAQALNNSLVQTTSSAFAAFGGALAKGENAFAAFGKSILASLGQLLISFGTTLVAIGFGLSTVPFLFGLQGPAAVAAGLAAIVLGGALSALGGGGGGGPAPTGGGALGATGPTVPDPTNPVGQLEDVEQNRGPQVTVNVQGNILDRRETGLEIANIIQSTFGNQALVFNT
jgi:hypothetical protein